MTDTVRVRFAPSPTGKLHIGGARTALFNWAYARRHGGKFLLRIEDTDPERSTKEYERAILAGLRWLGIDWDEGPDVGGPYAPYHQAQRIDRHRAAAQAMLARGEAYRCFCSHERLDAMRAEQEVEHQASAYDQRCRAVPLAEAERRAAAGEPFVVRFRVPQGSTSLVDHVRGDVTFQNAEVDDWIMVRSDGNPTYNFVVVCDDVDMRITHVFRGEEHLINTPKQVLLYRAMGAKPPEFGHLPLMLGTDRKKLSKRTGDTALQDYQEKGYPKDAVVNFLCLQGWALNGTQEIFSLDELVRNFDIADVSKAGAVFDIDKFRWLAGEYLRKEPIETLLDHCAPFAVSAGLVKAEELASKRAWLASVLAAEKERMHVYSDFPARIAYLFAKDDELPYEPDAEANARKHGTRAALLADFAAWLAPRLAAGEASASLRDAMKAWLQERKAKMPELLQPLRCALSGRAGGPDCFDMIAWLGPERSRARIASAVRRLA
ncbi:MAG: glutamate--tRNA ligase [Planctomycetes bacterium]|nr:glutamate--tRNA ligase [Planctomycetota bacterium]